MHDKKLSQAQSKWLVEALREDYAAPIKDKTMFAQLTPRQISDRLAGSFGISVDEHEIAVLARLS